MTGLSFERVISMDVTNSPQYNGVSNTETLETKTDTVNIVDCSQSIDTTIFTAAILDQSMSDYSTENGGTYTYHLDSLSQTIIVSGLVNNDESTEYCGALRFSCTVLEDVTGNSYDTVVSSEDDNSALIV